MAQKPPKKPGSKKTAVRKAAQNKPAHKKAKRPKTVAKASPKTSSQAGARTPSRQAAKPVSKSARRSLKTASKKQPKKLSLGTAPRKARTASGEAATDVGLGGMLRRAVLLIVFWGSVAAAGLIIYGLATLPDPAQLWAGETGTRVTILGADGARLTDRGTSQGRPVTVKDLPEHLVQAVIAVEDRRFFHHFGLDPIGIARAAYANWRADAVVQGGSTITQQLAKIVFLTPERSLTRKAQEALLALWLEHRFTKEQILALYLNKAYLGAGTYGVEAAAQRYFGKSARQVSVAEGAILAGLLKAPSRLAPSANRSGALARADLVLGTMVDAGFLTPDARRAALADAPRILRSAQTTNMDYAADYAVTEARRLIGPAAADLVIETTIDPRLQGLGETALLEGLVNAGPETDVGNGALVALAPDGAIRALVGGRSYRESPFNRAVQARRQPGSAFKPFLYLAALRAGVRPDDVIDDKPVRYGDWAPANYKDAYNGPVTVAEAFARSLNSVAVQLTRRVGPRAVASAAREMGLETKVPAVRSIGLGTHELPLLDLTAAYAPFAAGGRQADLHIIRRIRTVDGAVLYVHRAAARPKVLRDSEWAAMTDLFSKTIAEGTGRGAQLDRPAGGKTGTSQNSRDALFLGFTPQLIAGVWVGNDDGRSMDQVTGGTVPARIWQRFMTAAHAGLAAEPLGPEPVSPPGRREKEDPLGTLIQTALTQESTSLSHPE